MKDSPARCHFDWVLIFVHFPAQPSAYHTRTASGINDLFGIPKSFSSSSSPPTLLIRTTPVPSKPTLKVSRIPPVSQVPQSLPLSKPKDFLICINHTSPSDQPHRKRCPSQLKGPVRDVKADKVGFNGWGLIAALLLLRLLNLGATILL